MAGDSPLSEDQLRELQEIVKLPPDQQQRQLQTFLKGLTPEQVQFLQKQQGGGCVFCAIAEGKLTSKTIYDSEGFLAVLDIKPAAKGHVLVFPKKHYSLLAQMSDDELGRLFVTVTKLSRVVFEGMKAEGTNIHIAQGGVAGQVFDHVVVHLIPRWKGDKIAFAWEPVKIDEKELDEIQQRLVGLVPQVLVKEEKIITEQPLPSFEEEERRIP